MDGLVVLAHFESCAQWIGRTDRYLKMTGLIMRTSLLKFKTNYFRKISNQFRGIYGIYVKLMKNNPKKSPHVSGWTWKLWSGRTGSELQMNWLSLRKNWLKFKTSGELPITLEEFLGNIPKNYYRKTEGCQHVTSRTCKHLDLNRLCPNICPITAWKHSNFDRFGPKNLPRHCSPASVELESSGI